MAAVPGKRRRSGTGKPADKLICRQRFFLPGKQPQRQPADLGPVLPQPGRAREQRGGGEGVAGQPPLHLPLQFHLAKASQGVIQAEPTLGKLGSVSLQVGRTEPSQCPAPPPPPPRTPRLLGCSPQPFRPPLAWPWLGTSLVGGELNKLAWPSPSQTVPWGGPSLRLLVRAKRNTDICVTLLGTQDSELCIRRKRLIIFPLAEWPSKYN